MNYSALIQNRKSVREFTGKKISDSEKYAIISFFQSECAKLIPSIHTELMIFDSDAKEKLEGAAGYKEFMIGAPAYMVLLSETDEFAGVNAGFIMEDLILKLTEMDLATCWITFTDGEKVKSALNINSELNVAAICAFGFGAKSKKSLRLNIFSMSNVDVKAKKEFFDPKKSVGDIVFMNNFGNSDGLDEYIGFYGDMLWEAFYAASLSPSYLNRQPYAFVIYDDNIILVSQKDPYTDKIDEELNLGIVLLHFTGTAAAWAGKIDWKLGSNVPAISLPDDCRAVACCRL